MKIDNPDGAFTAFIVRMSGSAPGAQADVGCALFQRCRSTGKITLETIGPHKLWAWEHTKVVLAAPELGDWEFRISGDDDA